MTKKIVKKLKLTVETVRILSEAALNQVAGGASGRVKTKHTCITICQF